MRTVRDFVLLVSFCRGKQCKSTYSVIQFAHMFNRLESVYPVEFMMWETLVLRCPDAIAVSDPEAFCEWMSESVELPES